MIKRYCKLVFARMATILIIACLMMIPSLYAEGIVLDGDVSEPGWTPFYSDAIESPVFSLYTASDLENIYLGIVLEGNVDPANVIVEFAFRAKEIDYWIQIKEETMRFRASGGTWKGWWYPIMENLPPGVTIAMGETDGDTSYEICITKDLMGGYADDFPEKLKIWLKIEAEGETNFYPEDYAGWWFVVEQDKDERYIEFGAPEEPKFNTPELPFGTILSLATMAGALLIASKKSLKH